MNKQEVHWNLMDEILDYHLNDLRSRLINSTTEELEEELKSLVRSTTDNNSITIK
jgi:hypothetical protein